MRSAWLSALRPHPTGRRRWSLRRLAYGVYLFLAVLLGTEALLRWFDPVGISYIYEVRRYFGEMVIPDERFAYIHKPGLVTTAQGVGVSINSHGLRGPEFPVNQPADQIRVIILGDSVVFGWGVEDQATFPRLLQVAMDRWGIPVEIIAAGVGSWNTRTEYEWFRHVGVDLAPDVLLLVIVGNDADPHLEGFTEISKAELSSDTADRGLFGGCEACWRFARSWYLAAHFKYYWERRSLTRVHESIEGSSPQWRDARMALDGLIDLCRERGIELVVYLYSSARMLHAHRTLMLYRDHLTSRDIRPLTTPEVVEQARFYNSAVDTHLNAEGQVVLAQAIFEELVPRLAARWPELAPGEPVTR